LRSTSPFLVDRFTRISPNLGYELPPFDGDFILRRALVDILFNIRFFSKKKRFGFLFLSYYNDVRCARN
jgi:hypothetical protein